MSANAIGLVPENYKDFEQTFVADSDRTADKYSGYSFVFTRSEVGKKLKPL
jgi:hypothetical protein